MIGYSASTLNKAIACRSGKVYSCRPKPISEIDATDESGRGEFSELPGNDIPDLEG
jgi:hypothetical protein